MPHRGDTPMVDVRDCAAAHIEAAERPTAAGLRFILSTATAVPRARLLQLDFSRLQDPAVRQEYAAAVTRHVRRSALIAATMRCWRCKCSTLGR